MKTTMKAILKAIGSEKLELVKGEGYYYFVYDNNGPRYDTRTVYCMYLSQMSVDRWADAGREFVRQMKA